MRGLNRISLRAAATRKRQIGAACMDLRHPTGGAQLRVLNRTHHTDPTRSDPAALGKHSGRRFLSAEAGEHNLIRP